MLRGCLDSDYYNNKEKDMKETYTLHLRRSIGGVVIVSARKPHCARIWSKDIPYSVRRWFDAYSATLPPNILRTPLSWDRVINLIREEDVSKVTRRGKLGCYVTITLDGG